MVCGEQWLVSLIRPMSKWKKSDGARFAPITTQRRHVWGRTTNPLRLRAGRSATYGRAGIQALVPKQNKKPSKTIQNLDTHHEEGRQQCSSELNVGLHTYESILEIEIVVVVIQRAVRPCQPSTHSRNRITDNIQIQRH